MIIAVFQGIISEMMRVQNIPSPLRRGAGSIHLYGWDARSETWHGPNELSRCSTPDKRLLQTLRAAPGKSWYGPVTCCTSGERATRFFALLHDLSDCAI